MYEHIFSYLTYCLLHIWSLAQSPPKRDLKVSDPDVKNLSLSELQLAPSSVLLLRFQDESLNGMCFHRESLTKFDMDEGSDYPAPLAESVLSQAVDLPSPPVFADSTANTSSTSTSKSAISSGVGPKNLPKWFKMGQSLWFPLNSSSFVNLLYREVTAVVDFPMSEYF
jgi:tether containing UBX domain for GLUT4